MSGRESKTRDADSELTVTAELTICHHVAPPSSSRSRAHWLADLTPTLRAATHSISATVNLSDEEEVLSDGGEDDMTPEQHLQLATAASQVRDVLGSEQDSGITDKEISDKVWDLYFDVAASIDALLSASYSLLAIDSCSSTCQRKRIAKQQRQKRKVRYQPLLNLLHRRDVSRRAHTLLHECSCSPRFRRRLVRRGGSAGTGFCPSAPVPRTRTVSRSQTSDQSGCSRTGS